MKFPREYKITGEHFSEKSLREYAEWMLNQGKKKNKKKKKTEKAKKKKAVKKKIPIKFTPEAYKEELKDKRWCKVRDMVMKRDGYRCVLCGSSNDIQVHHTIYKGIHAWEYPLNTLYTLCKQCHESVHNDETHPLHEKYKN